MLDKKAKDKQINKLEKDYAGFTKAAYRTAYSITGKREDAEDIAQVVTMRYLVNESKVKPESAKNWVISTSKNESYLLLRNQKNQFVKEPEAVASYDTYEQELTESFLDEKRTKQERRLLMKKIRENLPQHEQNILYKYFIKGEKLSDILAKGKKKAVSKTSLYQKIYRLRKDTRAELLISKGIKCSKDIVSVNLNQSIIRFINKYSQCIKEKSFESMKRYFCEIGTPQSVPRFNIQEVIDYDVELVGRQQFTIYVHFLNTRGKLEYFSTDFTYGENTAFTIKKLPNNRDMEKCITINEKDLNNNFLNSLDEANHEGFINVKEDDIATVLEDLDRAKYRNIPIRKKIHLKLSKHS